MTLVVNLFGGPGISKSTTAALVFGQLKRKGVNAEIAHEYAKDLTWEERHRTIQYQPYVTAKQIWRVQRLLGQVDVVVTDSPILNALVYRGKGFSKAFEAFVLETFNSWDTLNIRLERNRNIHPYNTSGRSQTEEESIAVDTVIKTMLDLNKIPYTGVAVAKDYSTSNRILDLIDARLKPAASSPKNQSPIIVEPKKDQLAFDFELEDLGT